MTMKMTLNACNLLEESTKSDFVFQKHPHVKMDKIYVLIYISIYVNIHKNMKIY